VFFFSKVFRLFLRTCKIVRFFFGDRFNYLSSLLIGAGKGVDALFFKGFANCIIQSVSYFVVLVKFKNLCFDDELLFIDVQCAFSILRFDFIYLSVFEPTDESKQTYSCPAGKANKCSNVCRFGYTLFADKTAQRSQQALRYGKVNAEAASLKSTFDVEMNLCLIPIEGCVRLAEGIGQRQERWSQIVDVHLAFSKCRTVVSDKKREGRHHLPLLLAFSLLCEN